MNTPIRRLAVVACLLFAALLLSTTYIQYWSADELNADSRNSRTLIDELSRERGSITAGQLTLVSSEPSNDVFKYQRKYNYPKVYAPVTGYYSLVVGASGVEGSESQLLSGTSDQQFYRRMADIVSGRKQAGASVQLTINPKAQQAAYDALGDQRGAVAAIEPKTGKILALVSKPSYDPNSLASHDRKAVAAAWAELNSASSKPLVNRAIGGNLYPPGSTFKVVTASAAIDSGKFKANTLVPGPGVLDLPQTTHTISNEGGSSCGGGRPTLTYALQKSCNTTFAWLGMQVGEDGLRSQADKFGFNSDLRIPMKVSPSSIGSNMNPPQLAMSSIGQFEDRVTPLQMAMVAAGIANKGEVMRPTLISKVVADNLDVLEQPSPQSLGRAVSEETAAEVTTMMEAVVESGTGTRAQIDGIKVAGKTGTAQHAAGAAPHAWFISFAPADDPLVAVAVVVENGGQAGSEASGGRVAAPIAREVIKAVVDQ